MKHEGPEHVWRKGRCERCGIQSIDGAGYVVGDITACTPEVRIPEPAVTACPAPPDVCTGNGCCEGCES